MEPTSIITIQTPNINNINGTRNLDKIIHHEIAEDLVEEQNYQRNFLILRVSLSSAQKV
jgi:hypothetical protein